MLFQLFIRHAEARRKCALNLVYWSSCDYLRQREKHEKGARQKMWKNEMGRRGFECARTVFALSIGRVRFLLGAFCRRPSFSPANNKPSGSRMFLRPETSATLRFSQTRNEASSERKETSSADQACPPFADRCSLCQAYKFEKKDNNIFLQIMNIVVR